MMGKTRASRRDDTSARSTPCVNPEREEISRTLNNSQDTTIKAVSRSEGSGEKLHLDQSTVLEPVPMDVHNERLSKLQGQVDHLCKIIDQFSKHLNSNPSLQEPTTRVNSRADIEGHRTTQVPINTPSEYITPVSENDEEPHGHNHEKNDPNRVNFGRSNRKTQCHLSSTIIDGEYNPDIGPSHQPFGVINQINPPNFNGNRSEARSWLNEYDQTMNINGYGEYQKLNRVRAYLKGEASKWFTATLRLEPDLDWYAFKNRFIENYCGFNAKIKLLDELREAAQGQKEHPNTYFNRIVSICMEYDPSMSDDELKSRVIHGMNNSTYNLLLASKDNIEKWKIQWIRSMFQGLRFDTEPYTDLRRNKQQISKESSPVKNTTRKLTKARNTSNWECFNCGKKGHDHVDCTDTIDLTRIQARKEAYRREKRTRAPLSTQAHAQPVQTSDTEKKPLQVALVDNTPTEETSVPKNVPPLPCDDYAKPLITVNIDNQEFVGRLDSGADITVIPSDVATRLNLKLLPWDQPPLVAANLGNIDVIGMASVLIAYQGKRKALLLAIANIRQPIWGNDFMHIFELYCPIQSVSKPSKTHVSMNIQTYNNVIPPHPIDKTQFGNIDSQSKKLIEDLLVQFSDTFSKNDLDIGRTDTVTHRITLVDDIPIKKPRYSCPPRHRDAMEESINNLLVTGALRPSNSPYASPVFFVDKERGKSKRLVHDYRALNAKTIADSMPMPHPEDVFSLLSGTNIYTKLDITSMFNQIEVDSRDIEKTAITTHLGLFECPLMPFGLRNAPATAVRLMETVLKGLNTKVCYVYFDDIIVFARDIPQLVERCFQVLTRLKSHNLKLKPAKCIFAVDSIMFLGHIISSKGIQLDPQRILDVKNFPIPRNVTDVRSFYGLCSYNRKFIRNFAEIAKPLTPLMGKPSEFIWSTEAQIAFEKLRDAITSTPVLVHFNPEASHELRTDASSYALGAVLYQKHVLDEQTGVVLYFSKSLNKSQRNGSATERELLAAYLAIKKLSHYLLGRKFKLVTDHSALSLLRNHKDPHNKFARWVAELQGYDFEVVYKRGCNHIDADCLSRLINETPQTIDSEEEDSTENETFQRAISMITNDDHQLEIDNVNDNVIDISKEQREDDYCKKFIKILEDDKLTELQKSKRAPNFVLQDGILYYVNRNDIHLLVIPEIRRSAVLLSCHDVPLAGHLGFSRTYAIANCRYFWPKMRKDIKQHCSSCNQCQRRKISNTRKLGFIQPLPIAEEIFDTVGFDLITKLPISYSGHNTIFVCTDNLSKYTIAVPLKNEKSITVFTAFFNHVIAIFGCPRIVLSDNGANIRGEEFFKLYGIKRRFTSTYHPQTNGQTERFNRTLATSLTFYVEQNQKNWPDYVQALTFAYNASEHSVTHMSPFEFVFNRKPRLPIDNLLNRNEFINPRRKQGILSTSNIRAIKDYIEKNQLANKQRIDKNRDKPNFNEGDLVLCIKPTHGKRIPGAVHKLSYVYFGPYKIIKKLSDLTYELQGTRDTSLTFNAHSYLLRPYVRRENEVMDDLIDPKFVPVDYIEPETQQQEMVPAERSSIQFEHSYALTQPAATSETAQTQ